MVYELAVQQHPDFENFHLTHEGRIGWAQKKHQSSPASLTARLGLNKLLFRRK